LEGKTKRWNDGCAVQQTTKPPIVNSCFGPTLRNCSTTLHQVFMCGGVVLLIVF